MFEGDVLLTGSSVARSAVRDLDLRLDRDAAKFVDESKEVKNHEHDQ